MFALKYIFDRVVAAIGLLLVARAADSSHTGEDKDARWTSFLLYRRVGKDGKLFDCHKFRTMTVKHNGSTVSVAGIRELRH